MSPNRFKCLGIYLVISFILAVPLIGQTAKQAPAQPKVPEAPVMLDGKVLFTVPGALSFSASARADAISARIKSISKKESSAARSIRVQEAEGSSNITAGDLILMSVTDQDGLVAGTTRQLLAKEDAQSIQSALTAFDDDYSLKSLSLAALYSLLAIGVFIFLLRLLGMIFRHLYKTLDSWRGTVIRSIRIQRFELLPADRIADFAIGLVKLVRFGLILILIYSCISLVLGFFPWTRGYASVLLGYVLSPLKLVGEATVAYLPNIFFIGVIVFIAIYITKFVRIIFSEISKETITLPNFYPEWADPTYKIVRVLILVLTAVAVFPYLPGSRSPAFQGISIFLGVLLSLGSTSAVANVVAGVILTYMRAFKVGDRVRIADTEGDVTEKTLLITRIRTIKNVEITIANSMVLNSHIINFSTSALREGLILHTGVTIGYDAPWRQVHQLLIAAALECEEIMKEPKPFVLQTALDDFYVHYEINARTERPACMAQTYSQLHEKIQDKFNEAGVEIMSSHYANIRDGNRSTIPDAYLPGEYKTPSFRVGVENVLNSGSVHGIARGSGDESSGDEKS